MALVEVKVPDIGDFKDVAIIEMLVAVGDTIRVEQSLIAELWNPDYAALGFAANGEPFVGAAVNELADSDGAG